MTASVIGAAELALILTVVKTSDGVPACRPVSLSSQLSQSIFDAMDTDEETSSSDEQSHSSSDSDMSVSTSNGS